MRRAGLTGVTMVDDLAGHCRSRPACDRRDLDDWSARGGPLPGALSSHVRKCPGCADRVRRVSAVHASLTLLRTRAVPVGLYRRANGRALRMLRRAARASAAAKRLLAMSPNLSPWQRAQLHVARAGLGAAAALFALAVRTGLVTGIERTRAAGQQLASLHWDRHIDPDHEWLDPPHVA